MNTVKINDQELTIINIVDNIDLSRVLTREQAMSMRFSLHIDTSNRFASVADIYEFVGTVKNLQSGDVSILINQPPNNGNQRELLTCHFLRFVGVLKALILQLFKANP